MSFIINPISKKAIDIIKGMVDFSSGSNASGIEKVSGATDIEDFDLDTDSMSIDLQSEIIEISKKYGDRKVKYSDLTDYDKEVINKFLKSQGYEECFYNDSIDYLIFDCFTEEGYFDISIYLYSNNHSLRSFTLEPDYIMCTEYRENNFSRTYFEDRFNIDSGDIKYIFNDDGKNKIVLHDGTVISFDGRYSKIDGIYDKDGNNLLSSLEIFSDAADECGYYGGDQAGLINKFSDYYSDSVVEDIILKYFPKEEYTKEDLKLLFAKMNKHGCGYVAGANVVFQMTSNLSDEEFKKLFGFDRYKIDYTSNGEYVKVLNYDYMYLDYFLYYQTNYKSFSSIKDIYGNIGEDAVDGALENDEIEETGATGTYGFDVAECMQHYLEDKGIAFNFEKKFDTDVDENFFKAFLEVYNPFNNDAYYIQKELDKGNLVVIGMSGYDMYSSEDLDGNGKFDDILRTDVGGHAMMVTGTNNFGDLIVSSWGNEYIVKPKNSSIWNILTNQDNVLCGIVYDYNPNDDNLEVEEHIPLEYEMR